MTVVQNAKGIYCLSTDAKPTGTDFYTQLIETDTLKEFLWDGASWVVPKAAALIGSGGALTLPAGPDTLVGRATTDTLTNKTLTTPIISSISNTGTLTLPTSTDTLVGKATTDTLTNKTLTTPVIASITGSSATYGDIGAGIFQVINNTANSFSAVYITGSHTTIADTALRAFFRLRNANSANTEYMEFTAQGTAGFAIAASKDGSGSYRDLIMKNGGLTMLTYKADGIEIAVNDAKNISLGTTTGTKIGTATTQKLGHYGVTPVVQPAANADTSGATLAALETEVNELKATLRSLGLLAP